MSAQLEDGYTRIANELLDELPKFKFNGTQLRIIMVVWRFTYGFKRKDHEMSLSFFVKAIGMGKTQIDREITNLIVSRVLIVTAESTFTKARKIGFNKNYEEWKIEYSQQKEVQSAKTLTVSANADEQSANMSTHTVSKNADQERKSFKENIKDITAKPDYIVLQDEYAKLHGKFMEHIRQKEITAMNILLNTENIPLDFILLSMKQIYLQKKAVGEDISGFLYYPEPIKRMWKEHTTPKVVYSSHKKGNEIDWDGIQKRLEEKYASRASS